MRKFKYVFILMGIVSIIVAGCSNVIGNEKQYIKIQKRIGFEDEYEDFKEVTDKEKVQLVKEILRDIEWEKAKVGMTHPADYRFFFQFENTKLEAKSVLYELWISPKRDQVELVIDAESNYIQLNKDKSAELFEILTGEKLSNL